MACDFSSGRLYPCKDAIGGIKEVLFAPLVGGKWDAIVAGEVTDTLVAETYYRFELSKNSGSFVENIQSSVENGTVYFEQVLTIQMPKLTSADNVLLHDILKNRLCIVVRDNNDNFRVMGYSTGAEVTGGNWGTGTAKGDLNGYNIVFTAEEAVPAPFAPNLESAVPANVTVTPTY